MNNQIIPLQFARAIQQALDYRNAGMSQIEAVQQSCRTVGISVQWAMILQLTLEGSSALAENWAEKMHEDALDRAHGNQGEFR